MGLKGKSKLDQLEMPQFDEFPVIPDNEEELDRQIRDMVGDDPNVNGIFEKAEQYAELNATSCDATHKLACLQLVRDELADTRRLLWWALFELRKARKSADATVVSAENVTNGITDAIVKAENTVITVNLEPGEEEALRRHREALIEKEKELMNQQHEKFKETLDAH